MSRILFAWELGDNFGHLSRDLPVARLLRARGHEVIFAVRDSAVGVELLGGDHFPFVQAPVCLRNARLGQPPVNYADILHTCGYHNSATLLGLVDAWRHLFALIRPDTVVLDYAPTALLAARVDGLPAVLTGSGFEIPPAVSPFPALQDGDEVTLAQLQFADEQVLRTVNQVLVAHRCTPLARLADLFEGCPTVLTTFAELDHYRDRDAGAIYVGPISALSKTLPVHWLDTAQRARILCYLRPSIPGLEPLLLALRDSDAQTICALPGASASLRQRCQGSNLQIVPGAIALDRLLPSASLAIAYGSGTATAALLAGVPLLLVPQLTEQFIVGRRVEALGAGLYMRTERTRQDFATAIATLRSDASYRQSGGSFAKKYAGFGSEGAAARVAEIVEAATALAT